MPVIYPFTAIVGQERMRRALVLNAVDPELPGELDLGFFGGEPLLAWETVRTVMEETLSLAARRKTGAKFHITTHRWGINSR